MGYHCEDSFAKSQLLIFDVDLSPDDGMDGRALPVTSSAAAFERAYVPTAAIPTLNQVAGS